MSDETSDLDEMLGFLAEEGRHRRDPEEHPSPETLTAYQANELSPKEDERIQSHLAACRHCTAMLLELEEFLRPSEPEPAADFEAAADWRRLRGLPAAAPPSQTRPIKEDQDYREVKLLRTVRALAAALVFLSISFFLYQLHQQRSGSLRVVQAQQLYFGETRSAEGSKIPEVRLPAALSVGSDSVYPKYRIEIRSASEKRSIDFTQAPETSTTIVLPDNLSPGIYKVQLLGVRDGQAEAIGSPKDLKVVR